MRRHRYLLTVIAAVLVSAPGAAQEFDTRPGIAVFPFTNGGSYGPGSEDLAPLQVGVQQMLLTELAQNSELRIVERSRLREILDEQGLVTGGQVDPQTAARIGQLVGARYAVTGAFVDLYGTFRLDGRIVDVETGEILRTAEVRDRKQNLYDLLVELADQVTRGVRLRPLAAEQVRERKAREIPAEAVLLYSRAQIFQDLGDRQGAIQLYRQLTEEFPEMTEAREALRQLGSDD